MSDSGPPSARQSLVAILLLVGAAATYAAFGPFIRYLGKHFGDFSQAAGRMAVACIILTVLSAPSSNADQKKPHSWLWTVLFITSFPSSIIAFTFSVQMGTVAIAVFLLYGGSLLTATVGSWWLGTPRIPKQIVGMATTLGGIALASLSSLSRDHGSRWAICIGLLAGMFDGGANLARRALGGRAEANTLLRAQFAFGAILAGALALAFDPALVRDSSAGAYVLLVLYGVLILGLGRILLYCFQIVPTGLGTQILSAEIIFAAAIGAIFLGEEPSAALALAGALIILGVGLSATAIRQQDWNALD